MGLFKKVGRIAGAAVGGVPGYLIGGTVGKMLDGGKEGPFQFSPDLSRLRKDIQKVRDERDREITGPRKSAQLTLDQIEADRVRGMSDLEAGRASQLEAAQSSLARQGGIDSGARERLAQESQRQGLFAKQQATADFARLETDVRAQDFAQQEQLKNQALFATPQLSRVPTQFMLQAQAANAQARAVADARKRAGLGAIGSLAGAGLGAFLGGPAGASVGASVGGGLFSSMG
jgi:hypothetical protein